MRKLFLGFAILGALGLTTSCNKMKQAKEAVEQAATQAATQVADAAKPIDVNYRMFEVEAESKKVFDDVVAHLGEQAKVTDEVRIYISRDAHEGRIKRANEADELNITLHVQDPTNLKRIRETIFWSDNGGWKPSEQMEINVIGSNAENFKLEDELFDFNQITFEIFHKVLQDAYAKYKDDAKYEYQYIKSVTIDKKGFDVTIYGKLASNEQEKNNYYRADLKGNAKK